MKNIEIHENLEKKEIRDYLSNELYNLHRKGICGDVNYYQKQLDKAKQNLEDSKKYDALYTIMKDFKWDVNSVSDEIEDYNSDTYFEFIGTTTEFKNLIKEIKK